MNHTRENYIVMLTKEMRARDRRGDRGMSEGRRESHEANNEGIRETEKVWLRDTMMICEQDGCKSDCGLEFAREKVEC